VSLAAATRPAGFPLWTKRHGTWALVALHLVFVIPTWSYVIWGSGPTLDPPDVVPVVVISSVIGAMQLRHSLAAAGGRRPDGWRWTFPLLLALVYVPFPWFTWYWTDMQWFAVASAAMLLSGWRAVVVPVGLVAGYAAVVIPAAERAFHFGPAMLATRSFASVFGLAAGAAVLYWSARLVRRIDELFDARFELAEVAVEGERRRISRDLHDVLGQSLSAVSLKGDLAIRLLPSDQGAALAEIESLTGVARDALRDVRAVAIAEHQVSLQAEIDGAASLLGAAGIDVHLDLDLPGSTGPVEHLLAWVVREGTTNMLRHSEAQNCWIAAGRSNGAVRLEMVNDGARAPAGRGSGLAGLAERAGALSGSVLAGQVGGGRFRLVVDVPEESL
jgi:two-component system, NarL family, sensor histidine kinase DesK